MLHCIWCSSCVISSIARFPLPAICQVKPWSSIELAMVYVGTHTTMPTHNAA